jgi:hypothetical protein
MDALQGGCRMAGVGTRLEGLGGGEAEDRAQSLTAGLERVAHGGVQAGRTRIGGRRQGAQSQFRGLNQGVVLRLEPGGIHRLFAVVFGDLS